MNVIGPIIDILPRQDISAKAKLMLIRVLLDVHEWGASAGLVRTHREWADLLATSLASARRAAAELQEAGLVIAEPVQGEHGGAIGTRLRVGDLS